MSGTNEPRSGQTAFGTWFTAWSRIVPLALVLVGCGDNGGVGGVEGDILVVRGGWLLDGTGTELVRNEGIVIQDSLFMSVHADPDALDLSAATVIELSDEN